MQCLESVALDEHACDFSSGTRRRGRDSKRLLEWSVKGRALCFLRALCRDRLDRDYRSEALLGRAGPPQWRAVFMAVPAECSQEHGAKPLRAHPQHALGSAT
jgi:hypothetical protein